MPFNPCDRDLDNHQRLPFCPESRKASATETNALPGKRQNALLTWPGATQTKQMAFEHDYWQNSPFRYHLTDF